MAKVRRILVYDRLGCTPAHSRRPAMMISAAAWTAGETTDAFRAPASQGTGDAKSVTSRTDGSFPSWRPRKSTAARQAARQLGNERDMGKPNGQTMLLAKFKTRLETKSAHRLAFEPKSGDPVEPPDVADDNS